MNIGQDIIGATTDVFSTMLMMDLAVGDPVEGAGGEISSNITSMLGLGGDIRGMLAVHCPAVVARAITSGFLGMDVDELNEDVKDAIGEIANMVAGNLKVAFAGYDLKIELAIPTQLLVNPIGLAGCWEHDGWRCLLPWRAGSFWWSSNISSTVKGRVVG